MDGGSTTRRTFHWADYLLFGVSFAVTIAIGIGYAIKERWASQNAESFLLGDRKMNPFLNAVSFLATAFTSNFIVGIPAEFYYFGIEFIWFTLGLVLTSIYTSLVTIPKFRNMGKEITSGYEYIERRFNLPLRMLVAIVYILTTILYLSVVLYGPSVSFAHVTGQHILLTVFIASVANLIYTCFGGIRAIVMVDNIQLFILLLGVIIMGIMGSERAGGISEIYENYVDGQRNNWNDIRVDPWQRHTVWNLVFLAGIYQAVAQGAHQMYTQRYLNVASVRKAQLSQLLSPILLIVLMIIIWVTAMAAYSIFGQCEPLIGDLYKIERADQLLSLTIMEILGDAHGIPGIIIAAVFAAALSTLSSGLNALAAVFLEDFMRPCFKLTNRGSISVATAGAIVRYTSIVLCVVVWGLAMGVPYMGKSLIQLAYSLNGVIVAPIFGVFFVGFFFPFVEKAGATAGYICSSIFLMVMFIGSLFLATEVGFDYRPLSVSGCPKPDVNGTNFIANDNATFASTTAANFTFTDPTTTTPAPPVPPEPNFFDTSYLWYPFIGTLIVIIVSVIVSFFVILVRDKGLSNWSKINKSVDRKLLYTMDDFYLALGKTRTFEITKEHDMEKNGALDAGTYHQKSDRGTVNPAYSDTHMD